jgi:hypothetical protein
LFVYDHLVYLLCVFSSLISDLGLLLMLFAAFVHMCAALVHVVAASGRAATAVPVRVVAGFSPFESTQWLLWHALKGPVVLACWL